MCIRDRPTLSKIGTSTDTASCLATCPTPVYDCTTDPFDIPSEQNTSLSSNSREKLRKTSSHLIIGLFSVQSACPKAVDIYNCIAEKSLDLVNRLINVTFNEEFGKLVCTVATSNSNLIILGDFNFHFVNAQDRDSKLLIQFLDSLNLCQHVSQPTSAKPYP